jgi:hypothetical protein
VLPRRWCVTRYAQGARHEAWQGTLEQARPRSLARLLDPQREVVDFAGREDELAALVAWCEDDDGARLRLVTGPGGVGKTRLAVELAGRVRELGWKAERIAVGGEAEAIAALREVSRGRALLPASHACLPEYAGAPLPGVHAAQARSRRCDTGCADGVRVAPGVVAAGRCTCAARASAPDGIRQAGPEPALAMATGLTTSEPFGQIRDKGVDADPFLFH